MLVACLCAAWCRLCNGYGATFAEVARRHPSHRFVHVDIEDHADLVHAIDIEDFPTLLIADGEALRFLGVITPQPQTLDRLVRAAAQGNLPAPSHALCASDLRELVDGLRGLSQVRSG